MKTLLAVVNNPVNSRNFIRYSMMTANDFGLNLHFLYIQNPAVFSFGTDVATYTANPVHHEANFARLEADKENAIKSIAENSGELLNELQFDIPLETATETGPADTAIKDYISSNKADILILENSNENRIFPDPSNTRIALESDCPVWIIPPGARYEKPDKIVYATDYNKADIAALKMLIDLTGRFSPEITALHLSDSNKFEEEAKKEGFAQMVHKETGYDKIKISTVNDNDQNDLGEAINEFAADKNAKLVVLLKENRRFIERIIKTSSSKKVLKKTDLPVLVYRESTIT
jgi:hypothetical protein